MPVATRNTGMNTAPPRLSWAMNRPGLKWNVMCVRSRRCHGSGPPSTSRSATTPRSKLSTSARACASGTESRGTQSVACARSSRAPVGSSAATRVESSAVRTRQKYPLLFGASVRSRTISAHGRALMQPVAARRLATRSTPLLRPPHSVHGTGPEKRGTPARGCRLLGCPALSRGQNTDTQHPGGAARSCSAATRHDAERPFRTVSNLKLRRFAAASASGCYTIPASTTWSHTLGRPLVGLGGSRGHMRVACCNPAITPAACLHPRDEPSLVKELTGYLLIGIRPCSRQSAMSMTA